MADLTQGAVNGLLDLLTSAIKDEVKLLSGVKGDIQFIKDEMDSMNGFLLHLNKTETEHNDQHRAWMKQVREISHIAQDCIENYRHDLLSPPGTGLWATILYLPNKLWTCRKRRDLANKLRELRERVREVGERRLRYGVSVPDVNRKPEPVKKDSKVDERKEEFLRALEEEEAEDGAPPSFRTAISLLPGGLPSEAGEEISEILKKCEPRHVSIKMLLRALYAYPHGTKEELTKLKKKLEGRADVHWEVMVFCYSKLSTPHKVCLQYLTAFLEETGISRTILIRRWVAENLVVPGGDEHDETSEEAGERCFNELEFRGFVRAATSVDPGLKIKSCCMEESVKDFVIRIAESENFVAGALPIHFKYQLDIRKIAKTTMQQPPKQPPPRQRPWKICTRKPPQDDDNGRAAAEDKLHPMDQMVQFLNRLPEGYRLNVLDLGGCRGLKNRHLKSICKVTSLKYLSLRSTDVSQLPKEINKLRQLETLDVRQTNIAMVNIDLPKLKHLLASNETNELHWKPVRMPDKIGTSMEILRHVQIVNSKADLDKVCRLKQLRKLGVVLNGSEDDIKHLLRTISRLNECLRSLSVCIIRQPPNVGDTSAIILEDKEEAIGGAFALTLPPKNLESLNIKYFSGSRKIHSLPSWIIGLNRLSKITLRDTRLARVGLGTLGNLEGLCCLRLQRGSYADDCIDLGKEEFPKLRFLLIDQVTITKIAFAIGAAPKLEKIAWTFDKEMEIMADTINGIDNLPSLVELELNGSWNDEGHLVERALAAHPKHPRLISDGKVIRYPVTPAREVSVTGKLVARIATVLKWME